VITGMARAGIDALIEPPAARRRGRTGALLCENPAGAGCGWAGPTRSSTPGAPTAAR
jgi:hypothetical protein